MYDVGERILAVHPAGYADGPLYVRLRDVVIDGTGSALVVGDEILRESSGGTQKS